MCTVRLLRSILRFHSDSSAFPLTTNIHNARHRAHWLIYRYLHRPPRVARVAGPPLRLRVIPARDLISRAIPRIFVR